MTALTARPIKIGNVLKAQVLGDDGYVLEMKTVTVVSGMQVGSVLEGTSVSGKETWVTAAHVANADAILMDDSVYNLAAGDHTLACLVRGPAIVGDLYLDYADTVTEANKTTAETALKALGILVKTQI